MSSFLYELLTFSASTLSWDHPPLQWKQRLYAQQEAWFSICKDNASGRIESDKAQPTLRRENTSAIKAVYTNPFQVRTIIRTCGFIGCYRRSAFGLTSDFSHSHQTSALLPADINPLMCKSVPHLSHSINTAIFSGDLADAFCQSNRRGNDAS